MNAYARFDIKQAFVLKNDDILKIWKIFEDYGMEVKSTISCSDDFVRTFDNIEAIIKYENSKRASITKLDITGNLIKSCTKAEISFGYYNSPINVSVYGDENLVLPMRIKLTDILYGIKPWYSGIATVDIMLNGLLMSGVGLLILRVLSNKPKPSIPFDEQLTGGLIIATIIFGILWIITRFCTWLFPIATFAIGQGLDRHNHNEQIRWGVVISLLVGIFASVIAAKLS